MPQSIEEIIAERDMFKAIVIKQHQSNVVIASGVMHIRFYFSVMGEVVYGYHYRMPVTGKSLNRMGYDSLKKAQKGLEIAIMSEKSRKRRE